MSMMGGVAGVGASLEEPAVEVEGRSKRPAQATYTLTFSILGLQYLFLLV